MPQKKADTVTVSAFFCGIPVFDLFQMEVAFTS